MNSTTPLVFAYTKLQMPRIHSDVVPRERLITQVRRAIERTRVVLVSAPAGSGKTTLIATALRGTALPQVVWVALDAEDNNPDQFLAVLIAALEPLVPPDVAFADTPHQARVGEPLAWGRMVLTALINALLHRETPAIVVLDDLHVINDPTIFALLEYFIDQLPPAITLVIATRHDPPLPLARLRTRRALIEIRLGDLRFTAEETTHLLNDQMGLRLSPVELQTLYDRTEGWAAGLSLLASSLDVASTGAERGDFFRHLAQTERYLFDYLAEEVLQRQPPDVRAFLLNTSILPDVTPAVAAALTERDDAAAVLDHLYRHNLFMTLLEGNGQESVYRYHDLFADFLRGRWKAITPEGEQRRLHQRAGDAEQAPVRRFFHYNLAELSEPQAQMLLALQPDYVQHSLKGLADRWPPYVLIRFEMMYSMQLVITEQSQRAMEFVDESLALLEENLSEETLTGAAQYLQTPLAVLPQGVKRWERLLTAFERFEGPIEGALLLDYLYMKSLVYTWRGQWNEAAAEARAILALVGTVPLSFVQSLMIATQTQMYSVLRNDGVANSESAVQQLLPVLPTLPDPFTRASTAAVLYCHGYAAAVRGDAAQATRLLEFIVDLGQGSPFPFSIIVEQFLVGLLAWRRGDYEAATTAWRQAEVLQERTPFTLAYGDAALFLARLALEQNRPQEVIPVLATRLRYYEENGLLGIGMIFADFWEPLLQFAVTEGIHAAFAAAVLDKRGKAVPRPKATARTVLTNRPASPAPEKSLSPEFTDLSSRELEVLRWVARGASNQDIAEALFISPHTVKRHIAHVYDKLAINSRADATRIVMEHGLL